MKIRPLLCCFFTISFFSMKAQETFSANMNLKTEQTDQINFNETNIKVSISKTNETNKVSNTFEYSKLHVDYELGSFSAFENLDRFNQFQNKIEFSHTISTNTKLNFSLTPMFSFQENLNLDDFTLLGSVEVIEQLGSNISVAIGFERSTLFGYPKFIPTLSLNYKLNEQSTIAVGFPDSKITYSNNVRNKFSLINSFNGRFYNLDQSANLNKETERMSLSQMTSAFEFERNVDKNWFLNFKAGYDFNKQYRLTDSENHNLYDFNTGQGYILGIGIKYKQ